MSKYKVEAFLRITYIVDTDASNYDYVLIDEDGNALEDNTESIRNIEEKQTVSNLRLSGSYFSPKINEAYIHSVTDYESLQQKHSSSADS